MPYIPETETKASSGRITINEVNYGYVKSVEDLTKTIAKLANHDVAIRINFGFFDCPDDWQRNMSIMAQFEKNPDGTITKGVVNDGEISKILQKFENLGLTTITRETVAGKVRIKSLKGICINERGKIVLDDDSPIKEIDSLIETIAKGKRYSLYINKNSRGFDNIAAFIDMMYDENAAADDPYATELMNKFNEKVIWLKERDKGEQAPMLKAAAKNDEAFVYVPEV